VTERRERVVVLVACAIMALVLLVSCSAIFPHTELAIQPEGATLDELGIALLADVERWIDSLLFALGVLGWL
jgi:hypothetical protein